MIKRNKKEEKILEIEIILNGGKTNINVVTSDKILIAIYVKIFDLNMNLLTCSKHLCDSNFAV